MSIPDQITVALLAESFNLPIFNQIWLVKNGVLTEQEVLEGQALQTPVAVTIRTSNFELLIVPDRIQLRISPPYEDVPNLINRIVGSIVNALPHTPYTAIGLNFSYSIALEASTEGLDKVRELYLLPSNPLSEYFKNDDSRFGLYLSTDSILGTRLRLDIKPSNLNEVEQQILQFNFHLDLDTTDRIGCLNQLLSSWNDLLEESKALSLSLSNYIKGEG